MSDRTGNANRRHGRLPVLVALFLVAIGLAGYWLVALSSSVPSIPASEFPASALAHSERTTAAAASPDPNPSVTPAASAQSREAARVTAAPTAGPVEIVEFGIAYGTEKRNWLEWAAAEFARTEEGRRIRVTLIPMGSLEAAHAILNDDQRIHVWSPASSLYRDTFLRDWQSRHRGQPILKEESLARTPMVFVMWKDRYDGFVMKARELSFRTIVSALRASKGWGTIAAKPEWGRFRFSHTHPNQSNSGLMTLVLLACEFHRKTKGLTVPDVLAPEFQEHLGRLEQGVGGMSNSTGNLMREMILRGPSSYDAVMVYESVAIDFLASAEGRWEPLIVVYPKVILWSDNPFYILNTSWTSAEHQKAAERFLAFLMSRPAQTRALAHGFRPGSAEAPLDAADSPFSKYKPYGLRLEVPWIVEIPPVEVLENLQQSWIRQVSPR